MQMRGDYLLVLDNFSLLREKKYRLFGGDLILNTGYNSVFVLLFNKTVIHHDRSFRISFIQFSVMTV